jgi:hypothetical protein
MALDLGSNSCGEHAIIFLQLEYILRGKQDFLTSKIKLPSGSSGNGTDVRTKIDPDTQARLEALLEAAGKFINILKLQLVIFGSWNIVYFEL